MIIRKGTVIPVEGGDPFEGDLRIVDGRIVEMGPHVAHKGEGEEEIDARGCAVIPGFVQGHVHLCQTLFRGAADDLELLDWLKGRLWPLEAWLDAPALRASARLGIYELLSGGTTTVLDMGTKNHTEVLFEEAAEAGIRYTGGKCLMDLDRSGGLPAALLETRDSAVAQSRELAEAFHGKAEDRLRYAACPRFALSCSDELLQEISDLACMNDWILHTHAAESEGEVALVREKTGRDNIDYLSDMGVLGSQTVLAHGVHLNEEEINLLYGSGTHICHCPSSNMKLASGFARVPELLDFGINVALGADGSPCNNRLSMFREMLLAALIHKPRTGAASMPAMRVLEMATIGGARALGLEDEIGSLEVGKKADIAIVDLRDPLVAGIGDAVSALVYACGAEQVRDVFVEGHATKRDYRLTTLDPSEVLGLADQAWERLRQDAILT